MGSSSSTSVIRPDSAMLASVEERSGEKVSRCYHCRKCTMGCPLAFAMDRMPNQLIRMIQLGMREEALASETIWICASCQTCTTRCPNDIDIAHLMDCLRQMSVENGATAEQEKVVKFHQVFLDSIRRHGRVFELGLVARYKLATGDLLGDAKAGWKMFKKGKLKFTPVNIKGRREIGRAFEQTGKD